MTEKYISDFWKNFSYIQKKTKELYILVEEYDDDFNSFIQPIKEQRDALEHITRALDVYYDFENPYEITIENEEKIKRNLNSAIGHIFRAFFDSADVLSIELRKKLSDELKKYEYKEIVKVYPDYENDRKFLIELPSHFAKLRNKKDISDSVKEIILKVDTYYSEINTLFEIYNQYMKHMYPLLKNNI